MKKDISPRSAGIISTVLALVIIICVYTLFGSVDLVFKQDGTEVYRIEDASLFSELTLPEGDGNAYTYGEAGAEFGDTFEFRFEIAKTVLVNFVTFKWDAADNVIELNAQ